MDGNQILKKIINFADSHSIYIISVIIMCVFLWIISTFTYSNTVENAVEYNVHDFNDGWEFYCGNQHFNLDTLPVKKAVKRGTVYTVVNTLPDDLEDGTTLAVCTTRQTAKIYVGEKCISDLKNESGWIFDSYPLSKIHHIPMKSQYAGKQIRIEIVSRSPAFSGRVNELYYGPYGECVLSNMILQEPIFLLYLFILFSGIALILIFFVIKIQKHEFRQILYLGLITVLLALLTMSEYNMLQGHVKKDITVNLINIVSKFLLPFVSLKYLDIHLKNQKIKLIMSKAYSFVLGLDIILVPALLTGLIDTALCIDIYMFCLYILFAFSIFLLLAEICSDYNYSLIPFFLAVHILMLTIILEVFSYFQNIMTFRNYGVFLGAGISCSLIITIATVTNNIVNMIYEHESIKEELQEKRIQLMLSQIQPHFIYNTLNAIQTLINLDTDMAQEMIYNFSKYLRAHVDTLEVEGLVSFREELSNVKAYADIEHVRFPKVHVVYDIMADDFILPMLSVQPIVENAIRHGVSKKVSGGTVTVSSYEDINSYIIEVSDDGIGFDVNAKSSSDTQSGHYSVGLKNISYRLRKLVNANIEVNSRIGEGTVVKIYIPKGDVYSEDNNS